MLQALKARGVPAGILSNGDPEMLAVAVKSAGLDGLLDPLLSVHAIAPLQDRPGRLRAGPAGAEAAGARDPVRLQQRLGRDRRHLVRLHHAVGQPRRAAARTARHRADAHRQQPARRARLLSHSFEPNRRHDRTHHRPPPASRHRAEALHRRPRCCPAPASTPPPSGRASTPIVHDLAPKNAALLAERDRLQAELDAWHKANPGPDPRACAKYRAFLEKIGYLVPVPAKVKVTTKNVDAELALQAGPQLVVPITNARYALNAANARWGSLYDALYGTDVMPKTAAPSKGSGYNPVRGAKVIEYARHVLDRCAPLRQGSHLDSTAYRVVDDALAVTLKDGTHRRPEEPGAVRRLPGREPTRRRAVLLSHHGLHMDIRIDRAHPIGRDRPGRRVPTWCSRRRCRPSSTSRTRSPWSMPPTRCWPIATGSGILRRHADRNRRQGRQDLHARPQPGPPSTPARAARTWRCTAARCCSCATSAT